MAELVAGGVLRTGGTEGIIHPNSPRAANTGRSDPTFWSKLQGKDIVNVVVTDHSAYLQFTYVPMVTPFTVIGRRTGGGKDVFVEVISTIAESKSGVMMQRQQHDLACPRPKQCSSG